MDNQSLDEVKHPETKGKLTGLQELVFDVDKEILQGRQALTEKKAHVSAAEMFSQRLLSECSAIQNQIDEKKITLEEGKQQMAGMKRAIDVSRGFVQDNKSEFLKIQGKLLGLERAVQLTEARFNGEKGKYERWQRIEAEETAERAEMDTPPPKKGKKKGKK